jgi:hypothetical protein
MRSKSRYCLIYDGENEGPTFGSAEKLRWRTIGEWAMRPVLVVVAFATLDFLPSICEVEKYCPVQTFVPQSAVETPDVAVLNGPTWPNEVHLHSGSIGPRFHRSAGELPAVVRGDGFRSLRATQPAVSSAPPLSLRSGSGPPKHTGIPACIDRPLLKCGTNAGRRAGHSQNPCSSVGSDEWLRATQRVPAPHASPVSWFAPAVALPDRVDTLAWRSPSTLPAAAAPSIADSRSVLLLASSRNRIRSPVCGSRWL